jgi:AcrR family transcriptional regulator
MEIRTLAESAWSPVTSKAGADPELLRITTLATKRARTEEVSESTPPGGGNGGVKSPAAARVSRRRDRRKAEIVRTATEVVAAYGYQGTSLEVVAERTDIAKATLYYYFASKDELVLAALEALTEEVLTRLEARRATVEDAPASERLRALVDEQMVILTDTAPAVAAVFSWPRTWPEAFAAPMKDMRRRHDAVFRAAVLEGVRSGELHCANVNVAMQCLHGIMNQSAVWMRRGDDAARRDVVDYALRLFA